MVATVQRPDESSRIGWAVELICLVSAGALFIADALRLWMFGVGHRPLDGGHVGQR